MLSKDKLGYLFIIVAMLIWGSIGLFVRWLPYPSELIVFYRVFFAFLFLLLMSVYKNDMQISLEKNNKYLLIVSGIVLSLNWVFFFQAIKNTSVASATLSYYTSPALLVLLSILFLKERLTGRGVISLALGFLGIFIMILIPNKNITLEGITGIGYGLIAAFCYALFTLLSKKIDGISVRHLTLVQTGISMLILFPFAWQGELPKLSSLFLLAIIGIIHTALALILYLKGLRLSKVQRDVGILSYLDPLSAILFARVFLGEIPTISTFIGGVLILISSYLVIGE
ncbi:RarD protein [Orenia metallireducens]|uniref:DMT family transporter n=1 Tax=Orenia metallireducens TaxID=1413210 RepID=UPI000D083C03|nr:DMT family transporter [Orenia metallireducens]PRX35640.1 RarD protein [Orenia metallireducens]